MDIADIYDQFVAAHFDEDLFQIYRDARNQVCAQLLDQGLKGPLDVLDLGMGTGEWLLKLQELLPAARCHGVELSQKMIELAQQKFAAAALQATIFHEDANHFGRHVQTQTMDLITIHFVLNYIDRPTVFTEAQRCLKNGGLLSVASSTHRSFEALHEIGKQFLPAEQIKAQFLIPEDLRELEADLTRAGFQVVASQIFRKKICFRDFDHFYHFAMHSGWLADPTFFRHIHQSELGFYREASKSLFPLEDYFEAAIALGKSNHG